MIFFKNHVQNEAGTLIPELFLLFKKTLYEIKACDLQLIYFDSPQFGIQQKQIVYNFILSIHF